MIDQQQILEDVKKLLKDLDQFFTVTLKKEKLKKEANNEKEALYSRVKEALAKLTEGDEEEQEEYIDVAAPGGGQQNDNDELYDETVPVEVPDAVSHSGSLKSSENDDDNDDDFTYAGAKIRPKSVAELGFAAKEGILEKKRKDGQFGFSQWQSRYCLIKDNILYYYKTKTDNKQCNEINLTGYEASSAPDMEKKHKRKQFLFVLTKPGSRSFQFIAQSQESMVSWIDEIKLASTICPKPEAAPGDTVSMGSADDFGDEYEDLDDYQKFKISQKEPKGGDDGKKMEPTIPEDFGDEYEDLDDYQKFKLGQGPRPVSTTTKPPVASFEPTNEAADFGDEYEDLDDYQKAKLGTAASAVKVEESNDDFGDTYDDVSIVDTPGVPPPRGLPPKPVQRHPPPVPAESQGSGSGIMDFDAGQSDEDHGDIYEEVAGQKVGGPQNLGGNSVIHSPLPAPPGKSSPAPPRKLPAPPPDDGSTKPPPPPRETKKRNEIAEKEPWEDDIENVYIGMWDCKADERNELEFKRGDLVHILSQEYGGWWVGERNYKVGLVPNKYLMKAYI